MSERFTNLKKLILVSVFAPVLVAPLFAQDPVKDPAEMAKDAAQVAKDTAEMAKDAAQVAKDTAEMAKDAAEMVKDPAKMAKDTAEMVKATVLKPVDKTLEEVLTTHYETIGGLEAWEAVKSIQMKGKMEMVAQGFEAPFTMSFKQPMKTRLEFVFQGMTGIQAYDGETAWMIMPFAGKPDAEPMPADQADMMKEQADLNPFINWAEKGYQVELLGSQEVDGTEAYKIKLTRASGNVRTYYLDTDYCLPFKIEGKSTIQGTEVDTQTILGDYKEVDGLVVPHSIESSGGGGGSQVITIETVDVEAGLEDMLFAMPMAKPAAKPAEGK